VLGQAPGLSRAWAARGARTVGLLAHGDGEMWGGAKSLF
jgi:hypothetical protein